MEFAALHKQGPDYIISEGFLVHVLLLVFLEVCTKMKLFHVYFIPKHFLAVLFLHALPSEKYFSRPDYTSHRCDSSGKMKVP